MCQSYKMPSSQPMGQNLMELRLHKHCIDVDSQEKRYALLVVESQIETLLPRLHVLHKSAMRNNEPYFKLILERIILQKPWSS